MRFQALAWISWVSRRCFQLQQGLAWQGMDRGGRLGNVASGFPWPTQVEVDRARRAGEKSDGVTGVCATRGAVPSFPAGGVEVNLEPACLLSSVCSDALGGTGKPEATESPSPRVAPCPGWSWALGPGLPCPLSQGEAELWRAPVRMGTSVQRGWRGGRGRVPPWVGRGKAAAFSFLTRGQGGSVLPLPSVAALRDGARLPARGPTRSAGEKDPAL